MISYHSYNHIEQAVSKELLDQTGLKTDFVSAGLRMEDHNWQVVVLIQGQRYMFMVYDDLKDWHEFHDLVVELKLTY